MSLSGKTILVTGGSRGIGHAIALRCATEGANIVIAAKAHLTDEKIFSGNDNALILDMDVCDANAILSAVTSSVERFGSIDILVNNVSSFCFTDTLSTTPDDFDSLFSVNVRATFLISQACIPYLKKAPNPHIINISPPLDTDSKWFINHLAFTMSKYGMSMCTLGMAEEFRKFGIAVNSLWPQTTIATTTIKDHFTPEVFSGSRWPTIMADAAYELILRNARQCTGQFFIDEMILREAGVTDFTQYAVDPTMPLVKDLFVAEQNANPSNTDISLSKHMFKQNTF